MSFKKVNMAVGGNRITAIGDDGSAAAAPTGKPSLLDVVNSSTVKTAAGAAMLYHGYKRSGSILVALVYGAAGRFIPTVTVPIAIAQGFGQRKACP